LQFALLYKEPVMSVVIKIDRYALVIPPFQAAAIAALLESAKLYERDGYGANAPWKLCSEHPLALTFCDDDEFAPVSDTVRKVYDEAEKKNQLWLAEYGKRNAAEKRNQELEAELAAIKALRPCAMAAATDEPASPSAADADRGSDTETDN
jgi:hypothetical protein